MSKMPHKNTMPFQSGTAKIETRGWFLMGMNGGNLSSILRNTSRLKGGITLPHPGLVLKLRLIVSVCMDSTPRTLSFMGFHWCKLRLTILSVTILPTGPVRGNSQILVHPCQDGMQSAEPRECPVAGPGTDSVSPRRYLPGWRAADGDGFNPVAGARLRS